MKNKNAILNKYLILITIILIILTIPSKIFADVGSFESYDSYDSYDSGSDWGSSSDWDYDSDYSWGSGSRSSYSSGSASGNIGLTEIIAVIIIIGIVYAANKNKNRTSRNYNNVHTVYNTVETQTDVEAKVKAIDEMFNSEEFIAWTKDLFVKLQEAWTARDWSTIRTFESNELFEQHQKQLQGYIDNHQINKMERICVKSAKLSKFDQSGDKDILTVVLSSKMIDYIIDDRTEEIIRGDKVTERHSTYKMVFVRKTGVKTKEGTNTLNTTNCPNCGAPMQIGSSGKCEYCGSVITTGEYNWVLSNLEKIG